MNLFITEKIKKHILDKQNVRYVYSMDENVVFNQLVNLKQITFEVTDACNLRCLYCAYGEYYNFYKERKSQFMPVSFAKNIVDYLVNIWTNNASSSSSRDVMISFYGGEPLLNMPFIKQVVEYVERIKVENLNFKFSMTTNSILLDKYVDYLVCKKFDLLISLDGDEFAHSYRVDHKGNSSFSRVIDNVVKIKLKYPEYYIQHVEFNSVLTNRSSVEGTRKFIFDKFGKKASVSELSTSGVDLDKVDEFKKILNSFYTSINSSKNIDQLNDDLFDKSPYIMGIFSLLRAFSGNYFENYDSIIMDDSQRRFYPSGTCIPFSKKIFVTVNGLILPCERIAHKYSLGTVTSEDVKINCKKIASKYTSYYKSIKKQCVSCYRKPICYQCMFHIDSLMDESVKCQGFADRDLFEEDVQKFLSYLLNHPHLYERISKDLLFF